MNERKRKFRWKHALAVAASLALAAGLALAFFIWSGAADRLARRLIVGQVEKMTGAHVELGHFHFSWRALQARLDDLTLHGKEPEGTPPLFHADHLQVQIRVESVLGRKISLGNVEMSHFSAHVRIEPNGSTNLPTPGTRSPQASPGVGPLFALKIAHLRLDDGEILVNDTRVPLVAEGGQFEFAMDYATETGQPAYLGRISWKQFLVAARRYLPFATDLSARFVLRSGSISVTQMNWKLPHSSVEAQVDLASFAKPAWNFRYRGLFDLEDLKTLMRKPHAPTGRVEFSGAGRYAEKKLSVNGRYVAGGIGIYFPWFHAGGMSSRGSYHADQRELEVPDLHVEAFGGTMTGRLHMDIPGQRFRVDSQAQDLDLGQVLAAVDNPTLPLLPLHWGGRMGVNATTTWSADFKHVDSRGVSQWAYPAELAPGTIPSSGRLAYHYSMDEDTVELAPSEIATPSSHIALNGALGKTDTALSVTFDTKDLSTWDDFINRLRGPEAKPEVIGGRFRWQGHITGLLASPTFAGRVEGTEARYDGLFWDALEGDISYSRDGLQVARGRARRGHSSAELELTVSLDNWRFPADAEFTLNANLVGASLSDLQALAGTSYPVNGMLTGQFRGRGTRANPELSGLFDVSDVTAWSWRFDRARGQLTVRDDEVQIANAELRLPPHAQGVPAGLFTGNFLYHRKTGEASFDIAGAGIPLEAVESIQTAQLPVGGLLNLQLRGQGPLRAPKLEGSLRLVNLKLGTDVIGSFEGNVNSDGQHLQLTVDSAMTTGRLSATFGVTLGRDYPLTGEVTADQIDFDSIIVAALHLNRLTGHSRVSGHFAVAGFGAKPDTLAVEANLSRISLDYASVKLENVGPVRLTYRRDEVRVEQANLRGMDTDFHLSGFARFTGDRALNLRVDGAVNLQLLAGFVPRLESNGRAQVNAAIVGTLAAPRFNGRLHIEGATLRYGDFPAGLSNVAGDFNFDATRLVFENVSAESGGGHLTIGGTVTYANGPLSYALNVRSDQVRIRYPVGMSWLVAGTLRLAGTAQSATLSGRVVVDRLLMAEGFNVAALMGSAGEPLAGPATTSVFLRNLQFDIQADSSPDARLEWTGARFQTEANLRVRGTWEHPILLGHIRLLTGQMNFRGNVYTISRGDINFSNPFRIDPVINVEAVTTIRQYEVTLDFTGPASRLTVSYRSDPPLPSSDIITLLALGQTTEESQQRTVTGQAPGLGASTLLSEAISSQLGGRIERLFGISHFRVDPFLGGPTSGQNPIARVTIEQQVTRGLVITYITNVTSTQQQVIQIEYTINRELSIVALRDENGTFGLDIIRKTRFK
jgi:translocation and assembly module TamB